MYIHEKKQLSSANLGVTDEHLDPKASTRPVMIENMSGST